MKKGRFAQRSNELERMDTQVFSFEEFRAYLQELERVNRWSLAYRPTLQWLEKVLMPLSQRICLSLLDVGSGHGDTLRQIWEWSQRRGIKVDLVGVDCNPWAKKAAEEATPTEAPIRFETANVFDYVPSHRFDFITCSLFTHHLTNTEIVRLLRWMEGHVRRGWFINDLHRHPLPYICAKYAARLLGLNPSVRHDGPLSIARAFTVADWKHLLDQAEIPRIHSRINWYFPFRYCVTSCKEYRGMQAD